MRKIKITIIGVAVVFAVLLVGSFVSAYRGKADPLTRAFSRAGQSIAKFIGSGYESVMGDNVASGIIESNKKSASDPYQASVCAADCEAGDSLLASIADTKKVFLSSIINLKDELVVAISKTKTELLPLIDQKLSLLGGKINGNLVVRGTLEADKYRGLGLDEYLELSGGEMEGALILERNPTEDMEAATKYYVDANSGSGAAHDQAWSTITSTPTTLSGYGITNAVSANLAVTGATKTKITYDAKGLVTAGSDATTADIADSSNKRYVTDAQLIILGNTSNTNTGDQDLSSYITDGNTNWDNSYGFITDGNTGWDNSYGFITSADDAVSGTELDGVFSTSGLLRRTGVATYDSITDNSTDWNTAYGWGNHASAGYLTSYSESDPVYSAWDKSSGISITESQISDLGSYLTSESDPNALLSAGTDNVKDTHVDWGSGAGQVDADDVPDGTTNVMMTARERERMIRDNFNGYQYIEKNISASAIASDGTVYACTTDELFKSTNKGTTWTSLKTFTNASECRLVFVASNGYVYVSAMNSYGAPFMDSSLTGLWRSTDGTNFTRELVLGEAESIWGFDEDSGGNLYAGVYTLAAGNNAKIYKSTDDGDTFGEVYNGGSYKHTHTIAVDQSTDYVYAAMGDTGTSSVLRRSTDGGSNWDIILEGLPQFTSVIATPTARLLGTDRTAMGRIYRTTDDASTTTVLDEWYQNCFFLRRNSNTGNIYAGFKTDPSATSPLKAALYKSSDDGITWTRIKTLESLTAGEGFWFASNFTGNKMYVGWKADGVFQDGVVVEDNPDNQKFSTITEAPTTLAGYGITDAVATADLEDYVLLAGRSGGQSLTCGTGAGDNCTFSSTTNGTKGKILLGASSAFDEVNTRLGIGTVAPTAFIEASGSGTAQYYATNTGASGSAGGSGVYLRNNDGEAMASGDRLGFLYSSGARDGIGTMGSGAMLSFFASENYNTYANGTYMQFETTRPGYSSRDVRMKIDDQGRIGIGNTSPAYKLDLKSNMALTTVFTGTGLNDFAGNRGTYTGTVSGTTYTVVIDGTGTPDTFKWKKDSGAYTSGVAITGSGQNLSDGITIIFNATTGHTLNDQWVITATYMDTANFVGSEGNDAVLSLQADDGDDNADKWHIKSQATDNDLAFYNNTTEILRFQDTGNVGIGDASPDTTLKVLGSICAKADANDCFGSTAGNIYAANFIVDGTTHLPDYVFENNYALMPLMDLKRYLDRNKHLPGVPSADEVAKNGLNLSLMVPALLEKTEENTLYILQNNDQIMAQEQDIAEQIRNIESLKTKTDRNIATVSQAQDSISEQLDIASKNINSLQSQISEITEKNKKQESIIADLYEKFSNFGLQTNIADSLAVTLQEQVDDLRLQVRDSVSLFQAQVDLNKDDIGYLKQLLGVDTNETGDVTLLGKLAAEKVVADGIETGEIKIRIIDREAPTIGEALIPTGEKTVTVRTKASRSDKNIFVTIKSRITLEATPMVTNIKDGESFDIELVNPLNEDVEFSWWIVGLAGT